MRRVWSVSALICALFVAPAVNAEAPGVKTLTAVDFSASADRIEFALTGDAPIDPASLSARVDGAVLMIRLEDTRAERRWLDTDDALIKRTLLHPSRVDAPAAIVRTRLTRTVDPAMLEQIRVRAEGDAVVVAIPRSAAVARRWAAAPADEPATAVAAAPEVPAPAPEAPTDGTALTRLVFALPAFGAPAAASPAATEDAPLGEDAPLAGLDTPGEPSDADAPLAAGLTTPSVGGPGMGALLMSLLFLAVVALFTWRKLRATRGAPGGRALIRPVGTHMLGPKQSLLLVDVAGEMVLLGTTDKGVQMLTKIEGREGAEPEATPAPVEQQSFAERLGGAVARFRTAAARIDRTPIEPEADDAGDPLATLAARVRDAAPGSAREQAARRRARRHFAPVTPAPAAVDPVPASDPNADLLRKIRSLQSA